MLRRARGRRSMLDVALASHLSPETLRKIESGRVATPAFPTVAAIADTLGLSLDAVWAEINQVERTVEDQSVLPVTRHPSLVS
ncbi:helix-turn-helix transcriptional regulator [Kitasatospora sp. NPDC001603]|uniref:helix-turn-helix transcriptional regulator n=1 Tax=Kitasatospora sp. NPDC001603 TaxID=3154388 RepID=UPI003333F627